MIDALKQLATGAGWIPLILGFGVLPYIYVVFAIDVHKEYAEFAKTVLTSKEGKENSHILMCEIDNELYVFELEWWMIVAIAVMMTVIFNLGEIVDISVLGQRACHLSSQGTVGVGAAHLSECDKVRSLMALYGVFVTIVIAFRIAWARVLAARKLRQLYATYLKL